MAEKQKATRRQTGTASRPKMLPHFARDVREMQTRLTCIRAAVELLASGLGPRSSPRMVELADIALRNSDRLTRMLEDHLAQIPDDG